MSQIERPREDIEIIIERENLQGIIFSRGILVKVLKLYNDSVKLGISAPGDVTILREELFEANKPVIDKPETE